MRTVRIEGVADQVPVEKIFCLGRNYRAHALEMGSEVPAVPVVFMKPPTSLMDEGDRISLPAFSRDIHHEVEMVVLIGMEGKDIPRSEAMDYVSGYGVGLDLTARDVQAEAKKKGLPWLVSKGFDGSAPVSRFIRAEHVPDPHSLEISLRVNGELRQQASTSQMIFRVDDVVSYLSTIFRLSAGDLIFTGTPEGVGPIAPGDRLDLKLGDVVKACFEVSDE